MALVEQPPMVAVRPSEWEASDVSEEQRRARDQQAPIHRQRRWWTDLSRHPRGTCWPLAGEREYAGQRAAERRVRVAALIRSQWAKVGGSRRAAPRTEARH